MGETAALVKARRQIKWETLLEMQGKEKQGLHKK
jgi:hypothetical protein